MDNIEELEYLMGLIEKYGGGQYIHKYFGFTLKEVAERTGMSVNLLSLVIHGKTPLQPKYVPKLKQAFVDMDIVNRTKDFKEPAINILNRTAWRNLKNSLTGENRDV